MAEIIEALLRACTVRVLGGPAPGAGFFVAPRTVATCAHVIGGSARLRVRWERDPDPAVEVPVTKVITVMADRGRPIPALDYDYPDVALLDVAGLGDHPCVLLDADWPMLDDSFLIFGYPLEGGAALLTPARLTYRGTHGQGSTAFMDLASDTVKPGMSGAAVLNLRSRAVCGLIVASKHTARPDGALAVPWSAIEPDIGEIMAGQRAFHERDNRWAEAATVRRQRLRYGLPRAVAHFTGREHQLAQLAAIVDDRRPGLVCQILSGPGGVGKTQLAAAFTAAHADKFDIAAWIRADDGGIADLAALAVALDLPVDARSQPERAQDALASLADTDRRWLLVLDNIPGPEALRQLPWSGNGVVLATTRHRGGYSEFGPELAVDVLELDSATQYLLARSGRPDEAADAREVAATLGCLPLALVHAGSYCAKDYGEPFSEYLQLLDSLPAQEMFDASPEDFYQQTVAATWNTSVTAAEGGAPLSRPLMHMAAYLGPVIPRTFFAVLEEDTPAGRKRVSAALAAVHRYSLADVTASRVSVHRLIQKAIRDQLNGQAATDAAACALSATARAMPPDTDPPAWPLWQELTPHVVALSSITELAGIDTETLLSVLYWTCDYLLAAEQPVPARALAGRAVAIAGQFLSPSDAGAFNIRLQLGQAYLRDLPKEAIKILRPLAADTKRVLGPDDVLTLTVRSGLGDAYRYARRKAQAVKTLEPLAADAQRVLGPEHAVTMHVLNNLAMAYQAAGRTAEAIQLMEQITARREHIYGPDDFSLFYLRYNLAGAYLSAGRITEALDILDRLTPAAERVLGPQHQLTNAMRDLASSARISLNYFGSTAPQN